MASLKPIATDTYTLANLLARGCVYVDKTAILHRMIVDGGAAQYFMARPRRFGKSLTVSTLQAIFEGRRELFGGLAIEATDYDWTTYPVLRLDMGSAQADDAAMFEDRVRSVLALEAKRHALALPGGMDATSQLIWLIHELARISSTGNVVVLVDEYDKPLLGLLGRPEVEGVRSRLKQFYSAIKTCEGLQRFTFITGVSKFSKVSVFSDLNNLTDVTLSPVTATLCGYTHAEVERYFGDHLAALAEASGLTPSAAYGKVLAWYNGYRFHHAAETVVNPVSLGRCLSDREFRGNWYETGTPTFLVNELKRRPLDVSNLTVSEDRLGAYEPSVPALVPLLFQTGYLTIKSMTQLGGLRAYSLGFPNEEVRDAFNSSLVSAYTGGEDMALGRAQFSCIAALEAHDLESFFAALETFFANIPYNLTDRGNEQTWQAILYTVLRFIGVGIETEVVTNRGRIDAVIVAQREIYVIEIKLDRPAEEALAQIAEKGYAEKYRGDGRRVTCLGMSFSSERRTVVEWKEAAV